MVYSETLPFSLSWEHRLRGDVASIKIKLPDGRVIDGDSIKAVVNRLISIPPMELTHSPDAEYATQEFSALFLSWLYALPGSVLNRATPQGLCGQWRHLSEWVWLASKSGLPVPFYKQSSGDQINEAITERRLFPYGTPTRTLIVINGTVCGAEVPAAIREGCAKLWELGETAILGLEFAQPQGAGGKWLFAGATPMPDLRYGGEQLLDELARLLTAEADQSREDSLLHLSKPADSISSFLTSASL